MERGAEILAVGPDDEAAVRRYWASEGMPFKGLADPQHRVANAYGQQVKLLKLGRLPALMVIDKGGAIRYRHYGSSMQDIPPNEEVLGVLDRLNSETPLPAQEMGD